MYWNFYKFTTIWDKLLQPPPINWWGNNLLSYTYNGFLLNNMIPSHYYIIYSINNLNTNQNHFPTHVIEAKYTPSSSTHTLIQWTEYMMTPTTPFLTYPYYLYKCLICINPSLLNIVTNQDCTSIITLLLPSKW